MARVTVPLLCIPSGINTSTPRKSSITSLHEKTLNSSSSSSSNSAHAWSSSVYAFNDSDAEAYLLERHKSMQKANRTFLQSHSSAHFNQQLFPSGAGPFDLLLHVDLTAATGDIITNTTDNASTSINGETNGISVSSKGVNSNSLSSSSSNSVTASTSVASIKSNSLFLPLKLTCRVGRTCLHFSLNQSSVEVSRKDIDLYVNMDNGVESSECHFSRSTVSHLRRLTARWCPVVSYCTAASLAHPGWTDSKLVEPTKDRPVVVFPCSNGIEIKWFDLSKSNTKSNKRKIIESNYNSIKSKYAVPTSLIYQQSIHSATFIFDVEKYSIRIVKDGKTEMLINKSGGGGGISLFWRIMSSCSKSGGGGGGGGRSKGYSISSSQKQSFYTLPMMIDESRACSLVPMFDSLTLSSGRSNRPLLPISFRLMKVPNFWDRYLKDGFHSSNSFDQLHQCISINRTATFDEEDVRRLRVLGTKALLLVDDEEKKQWIDWLKDYNIVTRLINFACQYENMINPVTKVLTILLLFPPIELSLSSSVKTEEKDSDISDSSSQTMPPVLKHLLEYIDYVLIQHIGIVARLHLYHFLILLAKVSFHPDMIELRREMCLQHIQILVNICFSCLNDNSTRRLESSQIIMMKNINKGKNDKDSLMNEDEEEEEETKVVVIRNGGRKGSKNVYEEIRNNHRYGRNGDNNDSNESNDKTSSNENVDSSEVSDYSQIAAARPPINGRGFHRRSMGQIRLTSSVTSLSSVTSSSEFENGIDTPKNQQYPLFNSTSDTATAVVPKLLLPTHPLSGTGGGDTNWGGENSLASSSTNLFSGQRSTRSSRRAILNTGNRTLRTNRSIVGASMGALSTRRSQTSLMTPKRRQQLSHRGSPFQSSGSPSSPESQKTSPTSSRIVGGARSARRMISSKKESSLSSYSISDALRLPLTNVLPLLPMSESVRSIHSVQLSSMRSVRQALATHRMMAVVGGSKIANETRPAIVLRELAGHLGEAYFADHAWSLVALQRFEEDNTVGESVNKSNDGEKVEEQKQDRERILTIETNSKATSSLSWNSSWVHTTSLSFTDTNINSSSSLVVDKLRCAIGHRALECIVAGFTLPTILANETATNNNCMQIISPIIAKLPVAQLYMLLVLNEIKKLEQSNNKIGKCLVVTDAPKDSSKVSEHKTSDGINFNCLLSKIVIEKIFQVLRLNQLHTLNSITPIDSFMKIAGERLSAVLNVLTVAILKFKGSRDDLNLGDRGASNVGSRNTGLSQILRQQTSLWKEATATLVVMEDYLRRAPSGAMLSPSNKWLEENIWYELRRLIVTLCCRCDDEEEDEILEVGEDDAELQMSIWTDDQFACIDHALSFSSLLIRMARTTTASRGSFFSSSHYLLSEFVDDPRINRSLQNYAAHSFGLHISLATKLRSAGNIDDSKEIDLELLTATKKSTARCLFILKCMDEFLIWVKEYSSISSSSSSLYSEENSNNNISSEDIYTPFHVQRTAWWLLNPMNGLIFDSLVVLTNNLDDTQAIDQPLTGSFVLLSHICNTLQNFYMSGPGALSMGQKNVTFHVSHFYMEFLKRYTSDDKQAGGINEDLCNRCCISLKCLLSILVVASGDVLGVPSSFEVETSTSVSNVVKQRCDLLESLNRRDQDLLHNSIHKDPMLEDPKAQWSIGVAAVLEKFHDLGVVDFLVREMGGEYELMEKKTRNRVRASIGSSIISSIGGDFNSSSSSPSSPPPKRSDIPTRAVPFSLSMPPTLSLGTPTQKTLITKEFCDEEVSINSGLDSGWSGDLGGDSMDLSPMGPPGPPLGFSRKNDLESLGGLASLRGDGLSLDLGESNDVKLASPTRSKSPTDSITPIDTSNTTATKTKLSPEEMYKRRISRTRLYGDETLHCISIILVLRLCVVPGGGSLHPKYCPRIAGGNEIGDNNGDANLGGKPPPINVPMYLQEHLRHDINKHLGRRLLIEARPDRCGFGMETLVRLLCVKELFTTSRSFCLPESYSLNTAETIASGQFGSLYGIFNTKDLAVKVVPIPTQTSRRCSLVDIYSEVTALQMLSGLRAPVTNRNTKNIKDTSSTNDSVSGKDADNKEYQANDTVETKNNMKEEPVAVELLEYGATEDGYYLIMERCTCSLRSWRKSASIVERATKNPSKHLSTCLKMFLCVLNKTIAMHDKGVIHYDLKCDNILILQKDNNVKELRMVDFGEANVYPGRNTGSEGWSLLDRGTECIKSPEMLTISAATDAARPQYDRRKKNGTNSQSDVWSLGCLLFELIVGDYLFRDEDWSRFYVRLTGRGQQLISDRSRAELLKYGEGGRQVLEFLQSTMLVRDPRMRPTAKVVQRKFYRSFSSLLPLNEILEINLSAPNLSKTKNNQILQAVDTLMNKIAVSSCKMNKIDDGWSCIRLDQRVSFCFPNKSNISTTSSTSWKDICWMTHGSDAWAATIVCGPLNGEKNKLNNVVYSVESCTAVVQSLTHEHETNKKKNILVLSDGSINGYQWMLKWCIEWLALQNTTTMATTILGQKLNSMRC